MVKSVKAHLNKHKNVATNNLYQCVSGFLRTYHNTPHTTTGLAPSHLVLAVAPRTHLSMTSPSVYRRVKSQSQPTPDQTNVKVRRFHLGNQVLIRDLRRTSTSKWLQGTITAICGKLIYQVDCAGYKRRVHIDHLLPVGPGLLCSKICLLCF